MAFTLSFLRIVSIRTGTAWSIFVRASGVGLALLRTLFSGIMSKWASITPWAFSLPDPRIAISLLSFISTAGVRITLLSCSSKLFEFQFKIFLVKFFGLFG